MSKQNKKSTFAMDIRNDPTKVVPSCTKCHTSDSMAEIANK